MTDIILNERQLCDLEMLLNGGFAPLNGFMCESDYNSVISNMRLSTGELWPIPIVLSISELEKQRKICIGNTVTLRNQQFLPLATMEIESIFYFDFERECNAIFGCTDNTHPYIKYCIEQNYNNPNTVCIGGKLCVIQMPPHFDFVKRRLTAADTKKYFKDHNWTTIVAFQTRNPMHRSHVELTKYALRETGDPNAKLLLHPIAGETQDCDVPYPVRVRCYEKLLEYYAAEESMSASTDIVTVTDTVTAVTDTNTNTDTVTNTNILLSLLPLSMRMAGPREALWHALIRQNYGATHFIVGRDHAGPSFKRLDGQSFFDPYGAHKLLEQFKDELSIKIIPSKMIVYAINIESNNVGKYMAIDKVPSNYEIRNISGTQQRQLLEDGAEIPAWFSYPKVVEELRCAYKPKKSRGFCIYLVGLSGSGKTTLAQALKARLDEIVRNRAITILDGDVVRMNLSKGLGFSREDRSINVRRIGYVASEIVKHGGICLCANIAPYQEDRDYNRNQIGSGYIEVFVDTPLSVCEDRDVKGFYKLARSGAVSQFTGVSNPFEPPTSAELIVSCSKSTDLEENITQILNFIQDREYL